MKEKNIYKAIIWAIPTCILLILFFAGQIQYNMSDDYVLNYISMGGHTGNPDEHLLIINVVLGYLLKVLYMVYNGINWYGIMYLFVVLICTYVVLNVLKKYVKPVYALGIAVIFELTIIFWLTYTVLGYIATGVAVIKCVDYLESGESSSAKKVLNILLIVGLFCMGYMLRSSTFVTAMASVIPFIFINAKKITKKTEGVVIICISLLLILGVHVVNANCTKSELWKEYYSYKAARTEVQDYPMESYDSIKEQLEKLSISDNDYKLLETWRMADKEVFSEEVLKKIDGFKDFGEKYNLDIINIILEMLKTKEAWIFFIICLAFIYIDKRNIKYYILQSLFTYGMVAATFVRNRPVLRVIVPLYIIGILCMLYIFVKSDCRIINTARKKIAILAMILGLSGIFSCYALMNYNITSLNKSYFNRYTETRDYVKQNQDTLFLTDLLGNLLYHQSIKDIVVEEPYENIIPFGNWDIYNSSYYTIVKKYSLKYDERLIIDLAENDNIRCMITATNKEEITMIERFIEEHTNKKVKSELEDTISGEDVAIYNISYVD